jgi:hypothetical protein
MIFRRRKLHTSAPGGFYRFENVKTKSTVFGYGEGDFVRLRDEYGTVWNGTVEPQGDNVYRFRFRNSEGKVITGMSDSFGVILRDERGNTWRGFVE